MPCAMPWNQCSEQTALHLFPLFLLQDFFNGKDLCKSINPDEAVAYGAAVQVRPPASCQAALRR